MSTKVKNSKMEATRVIMTPLGSAASNVFNMLNMSFFLVFSTEALGLNIMIMGLVMTAMRIFDGITDPVIGSIIDRTETRFGKFRPFLVIGSLIMLLASFMIYLFSFDIPQSYRMIWVILWYAVWVIGYTFMTTVNKCVLSIVTKNPKYRPLSGVAGGCYSTLLSLIMTTAIIPILQKNGGLGSQKGWMLIIISAFILHAILLVGCLFAISSSDKPEFYRQDPNKKEEKITIKDSINVLRLNQPLRMLILAASTDKIASTIQTSVMTYFYIYAVGNIDLQPIVGGISTPMSLVGAFVAGSVAVKFGCKKASLIGAVANLTLEAILIIFRPFGEGTLFVFVALMALNMLFRRFSAQNVDPMIAEIIDYHKLKTGKFMPGFIGATFSLVDKVISAFGSSIVGILMGLAGYSAGAEPTTTLYIATIAMYLGAPLLGDLASVIALKRYHITVEEYKEMYGDKAILSKKEANK